MAQLVNYDSITSQFLQFIRANSTTINNNLYSEVITIGQFEPTEVNIWSTRFPAVSINLKSTEEVKGSINSYSNTNDNSAKFNFEIGCHIRDIKSYTCVILEMQKMVSNVASAIRSDMTASNTFTYLTVDNTLFNTTIKDKTDLYQKNAIINVTAYKYF